MSSANSVAKELVRISQSGPLPDLPTPYRLQCLLYYAQAWSLVLRDSELFPDDITALDEGPAVPGVLGTLGDAPPWLPIRPDSFEQEPDLDEDEVVFLRHLWAAYGFLSPSGLFAAIQSEAPFLKAKQDREAG